MSRSVENLVWASVGAGLGYLLTRRHLEKEFQKRLDGQIENADDYYRRKYEKKLKQEREKDLTESKETLEVLTKESAEIVEVLRKGVDDVEEAYEKQAESIIAEAGLTNTLTNYQGMSATKFISDVEAEVAASQKAEEVPEVPQPEKPPANLPVIISSEAFFENHSDYKQVAQIYYAGDDVLATESNHVVSDGVRLNNLGEEVMEKLKMGLDGDADVIYVRNRELTMEYEIFRDPRPYTEAVGPIGSVE